MYQDHFGLLQEPFSIAPDPSFLYLSESHNEALAHLLYGFSHGGFVLISGEVGTGKTTLLRNLLDRTPADVDVAFILNPRLTVRELLETLCEELGVARGEHHPESVKQYIDLLNRHLLQTHQAGRSTVVVIDEAQNLTPAVLEQVRLLTNLETNEKKLLRIILLGQPELDDMLAKTELRQLSQRITARYKLTPLSKADTHNYVSHRLARAGGNPDIFTKGAINALYRYSKGTPRLVNIIADRAMLGAYVKNSYKVTPDLIRGAAREVFGKRKGPDYKHVVMAVVGLSVAAMLWAGWAKYQERAEDPTLATSAEPTQPVATRSPTTRAQVEPPTSSETEPTAQQTQSSTVTATPQITTTATEPTINTEAVITDAVLRPDTSVYRLQRLAYAAVFNLWGTYYATDDSPIPCDFAPQVGLQCVRKNGSWTDLANLNMPVVLELWDSEPQPYYGALVSREGGLYTLIVGEDALTVQPRDLRDTWFGSYVLLWQTPPDYTGSVRQGDRHSSVAWLRDNLAQIQQTDIVVSGAGTDYFDAELHAAVIRFQQAEGLQADGVVGPMTWVKLHSYLSDNSPRLSS